LFLISHWTVLDVLQLLVYDTGGDDEDDRGGELEDNKALADVDGAIGIFQLQTFQNVDRIEGRQIERGVGTGEETAQETDGQETGEVKRV
jgi:hypothetical protein